MRVTGVVCEWRCHSKLAPSIETYQVREHGDYSLFASSNFAPCALYHYRQLQRLHYHPCSVIHQTRQIQFKNLQITYGKLLVTILNCCGNVFFKQSEIHFHSKIAVSFKNYPYLDSFRRRDDIKSKNQLFARLKILEFISSKRLIFQSFFVLLTT